MQVKDYQAALSAGAKSLRAQADTMLAESLEAESEKSREQLIEGAEHLKESARRIDVIAARLPEFVEKHIRLRKAQDELAAAPGKAKR